MNTDAIIIRQFIQEHGNEAALALGKLEPDTLADYFNDTAVPLLLHVIPLMNPQLVLKVFELMQQEKVIQLIEPLELDCTVNLIRMMNEDLAEKILNSLSSEKSINIRRLLKYMKNSVGSYMDPTVLTLTENMTVKEALAEARRHKTRIEPNLFVVTHDRKLAGVVNLSDLVSENNESEIGSIMRTRITTIPPETPVQSILNHPEWTEHYSLPIVDKSSVFLGAIRLETIRSIQVRSGERVEDPGLSAINALGELYQIGLAGLLRSATDLTTGLTKE